MAGSDDAAMCKATYFQCLVDVLTYGTCAAGGNDSAYWGGISLFFRCEAVMRTIFSICDADQVYKYCN